MKIIEIFDFIKPKKRYEIYTDGSSTPHGGSWAFVILQKNKTLVEKSGSKNKSSCNRMENHAAIEALSWLPPNSEATLYSDSRLLIDSLNIWIPKWRVQKWHQKKGRLIANVDQFKVLDQLNQSHKITWKWVKAHSGNIHNERCDELCIQARLNLC